MVLRCLVRGDPVCRRCGMNGGRLSATTERRGVHRSCEWREGQPSGWPVRFSRTVVIGCHPEGRNAVEDPRSGLTAERVRAPR